MLSATYKGSKIREKNRKEITFFTTRDRLTVTYEKGVCVVLLSMCVCSARSSLPQIIVKEKEKEDARTLLEILLGQ